MSKLRIIFDGVIAIGPAEPRDGSPLPGPLFGILPRAHRQVSRRSRLQPKGPSYIPIHIPILFTTLTPRANDPNMRPNDDRFVPTSPTAPSYNIWYPLRERLEFHFDEDEGPGELTYQVVPKAKDLVAAGDIRAIADMREIWPDRARIRREFLSHRAPAPEHVAAQVFIPKGHVSSGQYGRAESAGEEAYFVPKRTKTVCRKPLVPELIVTVEVVSAVHILSYSLDTGEKLDWLTFDIHQDADIYIGNGDPGDLKTVLTNIGSHPMDFTRRDDDYDFELYYPLLEGEDDGEGLPVPLSYGQFGTPHCYTLKVDGSSGG